MGNMRTGAAGAGIGNGSRPGAEQAAFLREAYGRFAAGDAAGAERALATLWADTTHAPAPALHLLGHIRRTQGRLPEAESYFRRAIQGDARVPHYHGALADLLAGAGAHALALESYEAALKLDPENADVHLAIARSALAAGLASRAEEAACAAIVAKPSLKAWILLAHALDRNDRLEEALDAVDDALALDPESLEARLARANLLERIGRNEEALAILDRLLVQGQSIPPVVISRGIALSNLARLADAEAHFADGVSRWPENVELQKALAHARWMLGQGPEFARDFEAAVAQRPADTSLRLACADLLRRSENREGSEDLLREGLARAPNNPAILQSLGVLLDEMDRTEEGLRLLERALAIAPGVGQIRANFACALLRLGRGDEALKEMEPLRRADPLNQAYVCYETMALRQMGHPRYREWCDLDRFVYPHLHSAPPGYRTIEDFNEELAESLKRLHVLEAHPLDQSVRGGSQTSRSLIHVDDPLVQTLLKMLDEPIRAYMDRLGPPDPSHPLTGRNTGKYRLTGSWSVKLKPGGFHINHVHPAGWISGPYYVKVPKIVAEGEGNQGWVTFGEPRWKTPHCTVEKIVQPQAGLQVIFPSYLWHGTIPFSEGERMTAPMDAAPV